MKNDYYPFTVMNIEEIALPVTLFENSRYKFEFIKIDQELIEKIFPNQEIIKRNDSYQSPITFHGFRLAKVYRDILMGNVFLKTTRKTKFDSKDAKKYNKGINGIIDLIHLFTNVSLNEFISFNEEGKLQGGGSQGNHRQSTPFASRKKVTNNQISEIQQYSKKYISIDSKKLKLCFELLRNADINGHNSFPLKCSLIVILIESFFLEGKPSRKDNFGFCLEEYFQLGKRDKYENYYHGRSIYLHSGEDILEATVWRELHGISKLLICDYLNDHIEFKRKVNEIKKKI